MDVPKTKQLFNPTLEALKSLGGSSSIREIAATIAENMKLPEEVVRQLHKKGPQTELEY